MEVVLLITKNCKWLLQSKTLTNFLNAMTEVMIKSTIILRIRQSKIIMPRCEANFSKGVVWSSCKTKNNLRILEVKPRLNTPRTPKLLDNLMVMALKSRISRFLVMVVLCAMMKVKLFPRILLQNKVSN